MKKSKKAMKPGEIVKRIRVIKKKIQALDSRIDKNVNLMGSLKKDQDTLLALLTNEDKDLFKEKLL